MYKVIIVDDEILIRKRIRLGFDWNALGYEVAEDVGSAKEALVLIREGGYDLAVVDIAMPGMKGIDLAKMLREERNEIQIIFLTGHSEFTYAQQAIRYGVYGYILKPVDEEEFTGMLKKLKLRLDGAKKEQEFVKRLSMGQSNASLIMESKFFSEIFHYGIQKEEIKQVCIKAMEAGVNPERKYVLAVFCIRKYIRENVPLLERCQRVYEAGRRVLDKGEHFTIICDLFDNYCIFFKEWLSFDSNVRMKRKLEQIRILLEQELSTSVRCGASTCQQGAGQLSYAYKEAVCALHNTKVFGENTMNFKEVDEKTEKHYRVPSEKIRELQKCVGRNDQKGCEKIIEDVFHEMAERQCNYDSISLNANRILLGISETCAASGLEIRWFMGEYKNLDAAFEHMMSLEAVQEWFGSMIKKLIESKSYQVGEEKNMPVVRKSCDFIQEHWGDMELTQARIAEWVGVTPAYLSDVFKKSMGISMMRYLSAIRLEKAKELLMNEGLEVREVAVLVGYGDEYYFSRCFKKYHGVSPSYIRKRL